MCVVMVHVFGLLVSWVMVNKLFRGFRFFTLCRLAGWLVLVGLRGRMWADGNVHIRSCFS